jgi:cellulose synthase/poly-beta-1,6-N-acetylglucosamine synthase-like glycosyltransferase
MAKLIAVDMIMLQAFAFTLIVCSLYYSGFLFWCLAGWRKLNSKQIPEGNNQTIVTVIVPARNEEDNISGCLQHILLQSYPDELIEILVVNDQSTDGTADRVREIIRRFPDRSITLLENDAVDGKSFKKQAISKAVNQAKGELILTTDADCLVSGNWISAFVNHYEYVKPDFIAGPVCYHKEKNFFEKIQSFEFNGLIGIGAGSISNHLPMMCNGANLAYTKKIFQQVNGFSGDRGITSGDDTQLLQKVFDVRGAKVHFLKSFDALVYTTAMSSLKNLFEQRKRWASKIPFVMNGFTKFTAAIAYLLHLGLLILLFLSVNHPVLFTTALFIFAVKIISEFLLIRNVSIFLRKKSSFGLLLGAQLFYMIYVIVVGASSVFTSYTWKERKIKSALKIQAE